MTQPSIRLNDGHQMPQLGFGVWQVPPADAAGVVAEALRAGYRSVDTAAGYGNEEGVGAAVRASGIPRAAIFVTTKLANRDHREGRAAAAIGESLRRLGLEQVDLWLIHWPLPRRGRFADAWRAFAEARTAGLARSIGVSNFTIPLLERLIGETGIVPAVNQVELHPRWQQKALRAFHAAHGIATESWSPLGRGSLAGDETVAAIARKHGRTPAQVVIRWHLDSGLVVIPKSVTPARIRENFTVLEFRLDPEDMERMAGLDSAAGRIGPDPENADF